MDRFHCPGVYVFSKVTQLLIIISDNQLSIDFTQLDSVRQINLRLDQILKNNVALSYFIDFVSSQGKQLDLFFYLNIEGK